jgi:hypothetical protein
MSDLWTFPVGMTVGHDESVKGYRVKCSDREVGHVAWADYEPGESYLVVDVGHKRHHLVPAGAITALDHADGTLTLGVTATEVCSMPLHEDPETAYVSARDTYIHAFERGVMSGREGWPYLDV